MKNSSKVLIALGAGLAIGGILGVLLAPDKGSVTRQKLAETPGKLAGKVRDKFRSGKEKFDDKLNELMNENIGEVI